MSDADRATLIYFQDHLLRLLYESDDAAYIKQALLADEKLTPFHDYIASFELSMIYLAAHNVKHWSRFAPGQVPNAVDTLAG